MYAPQLTVVVFVIWCLLGIMTLLFFFLSLPLPLSLPLHSRRTAANLPVTLWTAAAAHPV